MNIAMLSVHSCPMGNLGGKNTGGMSVYIRELARELGRRGHRVDVYTRSHESLHDQIVEFGQNARIIHLKAGEGEEIEKLEIYPHLADFARDLENFRKHHGLRYELIHSHYWLSGRAGKWIQRWWNVPHITMFHTVAAVKNAIGIGLREPELRLETERELVNDCHRIIASTAQEKEELAHYYCCPKNISVIPCGVNLELFRPIERARALHHLGLNGEEIILFVGRIDPLKGIDKLLLAMAYLKKQGVKLIVIGGDEQSQLEMERLKSLSRILQIQDSVDFHGMVKQEMLPYFYSAADLCVVPSYYESFGLVALESLACGTPVVATKVGCVESVIRQGETGYVVNDNVPRRLADKIGLLLSTSRSPDSIRASVSRYSWSNVADAIVKEYRSLIRNYPDMVYDKRIKGSCGLS
jgi:D-inositol-3-phosphate glycosyltransferase